MYRPPRCRENREHPVLDQVAEQYADHPDGEVDFGGEVDERDGMAAQLHDPAMLGTEPEGLRHPLTGHHHDVDQAERRSAARQGPAAGEGIGPDDRAGLLVEPPVPVAVVAGHSAAISWSGNRGSAARYLPIRLTSIAISYTMRPAFDSAELSTARQVPCPAAMTKRNADSISMMVCRTSPPWKCLPVPLARLCIPAARADKCSPSSRVRPRDAATTRPSLDRTRAWRTDSTWPTKLSSSQLNCPAVSVRVIT